MNITRRRFLQFMPISLLGFAIPKGLDEEKEKVVVKMVNHDIISWFDDRGVVVEVEKVPITGERRGSIIARHTCEHIRERGS